jgi:hypothetical protein
LLILVPIYGSRFRFMMLLVNHLRCCKKKLLLLIFISSVCFCSKPIFLTKALICLHQTETRTRRPAFTFKLRKRARDKAYIISFPISLQSKQKPARYISNSIFSSSYYEVGTNIPSLAFFLETKEQQTTVHHPIRGFISVMDVTSVANCQPLFRFPVYNPLSISLSRTMNTSRFRVKSLTTSYRLLR